MWCSRCFIPRSTLSLLTFIMNSSIGGELGSVLTEEAFEILLGSSLECEDVRHDTLDGDADDAEGMPLSSQPPSPLTPLPPWFDSDLPNPDLDPLALAEPSGAAYNSDEPPASTTSQTEPPLSHTSQKKRAYDKARKQAKRQGQASSRDTLSPGGYAPKQSTVKKHAGFDKSSANFDAKNLNVAKGGWIGKRATGGRGKLLGLDDLRRLKYRHISWTGE